MAENNLSFSKILAFIFFFLAIFLAGVFAFWTYQEKTGKIVQQPSPTVEPPTTVKPTITTALTVTPIPNLKTDLESIKEAMAKKHNKAISDVNITVSKTDDTHAWGSVSFAGEMGGGWFLAYKNPGNWIIVTDGNGTISCETIAPYNFPVNMVPECVTNNGKLIKR